MLTREKWFKLSPAMKSRLLSQIKDDFSERYDLSYVLGDIEDPHVVSRVNAGSFEDVHINIGTSSIDRTYGINNDLTVQYIG